MKISHFALVRLSINIIVMLMLTVMLMQITKCPKIIVKQVKDMAESLSSSVLFSSLGKTATLEYRISVLTNCMLPICYDIVGSTVS